MATTNCQKIAVKSVHENFWIDTLTFSVIWDKHYGTSYRFEIHIDYYYESFIYTNCKWDLIGNDYIHGESIFVVRMQTNGFVYSENIQEHYDNAIKILTDLFNKKNGMR